MTAVWFEMTAVWFEMTAMWFEMTAAWSEIIVLQFEVTALWFEVSAKISQPNPTQPNPSQLIYVIPTERSDEGSQMLSITPFNAVIKPSPYNLSHKKFHSSKSITAKLGA
jgi:hypothetical protein